VASVERYLRAYERSGGDIRALVPVRPARPAQGGAGKPRLVDEAEPLLQEVLTACAAAAQYRTVRDVYLLVVARVRDENTRRAAAGLPALALPSRATVHQRIREAGSARVLRRRPSALEAHATATALPGPRPGHILERVEVDHMTLDLILVDEEDRLPIGRPTITLALDTYSGLPFGVAVDFEPPSYAAVGRCLLHGILPKHDVQQRFGTANPWPVYGLPERLVADNAKHLVGHDLRDACAQLGIVLDFAPVRRPWFKGAIERQFRTHNTGLVHTLPGTTFSNVLARGDYDPSRHACISLQRFWEILHVYLLDVYAQSWHQKTGDTPGQSGGGGVPAKRWEASVAAGYRPLLYHDANELSILLGRTARRTLQRTGIDLHCLRYQSPALAGLRQRLAAASWAGPLTVKFDPDDLGALYVLDPTAGQATRAATPRDGVGAWLRVPAVDQEYACALSLWKHRVIHAYVVREMRQAVDVYALAAAKERIQQVVADEFGRTRAARRHRGRVAAARFLGVGVNGVSRVTRSARDAGTPPPAPSTPLAFPAPLLLVAAPAAADDGGHTGREGVVPPLEGQSEQPGWGADYGLPSEVRRPFRQPGRGDGQ
jgi:putative transposase